MEQPTNPFIETPSPEHEPRLVGDIIDNPDDPQMHGFIDDRDRKMWADQTFTETEVQGLGEERERLIDQMQNGDDSIDTRETLDQLNDLLLSARSELIERRRLREAYRSGKMI